MKRIGVGTVAPIWVDFLALKIFGWVKWRKGLQLDCWGRGEKGPDSFFRGALYPGTFWRGPFFVFFFLGPHPIAPPK